MNIELNPVAYSVSKCATFMRSRERHGHLSNITGGFPLTVNTLTFQSPEGLYQALKYPHHPQVQQDIAAQPSGMQAKIAAYASKAPILEDWDNHRVQAMIFTTALKIAQHPVTFALALRETARLPVVERSYRDGFWGAIPNGQTLRGVNALGKILTETRDLLRQYKGDTQATADAIMTTLPGDTFFVNSEPIPLLRVQP